MSSTSTTVWGQAALQADEEDVTATLGLDEERQFGDSLEVQGLKMFWEQATKGYQHIYIYIVMYVSCHTKDHLKHGRLDSQGNCLATAASPRCVAIWRS